MLAFWILFGQFSIRHIWRLRHTNSRDVIEKGCHFFKLPDIKVRAPRRNSCVWNRSRNRTATVRVVYFIMKFLHLAKFFHMHVVHEYWSQKFNNIVDRIGMIFGVWLVAF